jgi:peptidoglycan hydrolase CwlO-like protein
MRFILFVFLFLSLFNTLYADEPQSSADEIISASDPILKQLLHANRELNKRLQDQQNKIDEMLKERDEAYQKFNDMIKQLEEKREALKKELEEKINNLQKQNDSSNYEIKKLRSEHDREIHSMQITIDALQEKLANDFDTVTFGGVEFVKIPAGTFVMGTDEPTQKNCMSWDGGKTCINAKCPAMKSSFQNRFLFLNMKSHRDNGNK